MPRLQYQNSRTPPLYSIFNAALVLFGIAVITAPSYAQRNSEPPKPDKPQVKTAGYRLPDAVQKKLEQEAAPYINQFFGKGKGDMSDAEWKELGDKVEYYQRRLNAGARGVPEAPFKTDWHELLMKRMLRMAAENGYDRLSWTTGEQQATRYDLSKHVSKVEWHPQATESDGRLWAFDHNGNVVMQQQIKPEQIADYIGKEPAKKLLDSPLQYSETGRRQWKSLSGVDLKVGGDWAKALYDRAIPRFLNKYASKWNAKVGQTSLSPENSYSVKFDNAFEKNK